MTAAGTAPGATPDDVLRAELELAEALAAYLEAEIAVIRASHPHCLACQFPTRWRHDPLA